MTTPETITDDQASELLNGMLSTNPENSMSDKEVEEQPEPSDDAAGDNHIEDPENQPEDSAGPDETDEKEQDDSESDKGSKKPKPAEKNFQKLLRQRNEARKREKELMEENAKLKS